jgi:hypothetical protein
MPNKNKKNFLVLSFVLYLKNPQSEIAEILGFRV